MCSADITAKNSSSTSDVRTGEEPKGCESIGNKIDEVISWTFYKTGHFVAFRPKLTILLSIIFAIVCGSGFINFTTESRPEKLWVPQGTTAATEEANFLKNFPPTGRFNTMIVTAGSTNTNSNNVLTKDTLEQAIQLHREISTTVTTYNDNDYTLTDLCTRAGGSCVSSFAQECQCLMSGILGVWNYDLDTLRNDTNILDTLNRYRSREDLESLLGNPTFDQDGNVVTAEALVQSYFNDDQVADARDGSTVDDPLSEKWELEAFLDTVESANTAEKYSLIRVEYFSSRSFSDEFGEAITGDLALVQVSYVVTFLFLGATLGRVKCGAGSRWSMSIAAVAMIALSTLAGFGISSAIGLFYGPVHSLLPFVLLGIGVDDAFVIVNAFNRERTVPRKEENDEQLVERCAKGLSRAGASITVTSMTDLVAFAISSSSALPALASFCAFASICITFLWFFASTFFTACLVLDERRQRGDRWDCLCCCFGGKPRNNNHDNSEVAEEKNDNPEGFASRYFRKYHAPAILSTPGKTIVLLLFSGLLAFGIYGALNLSVEDSTRNFIPDGSYLNDYLAASDEYFPSDGITLYIVFENPQTNLAGRSVYETRQELAALDERLAGKSNAPPYIAEPVSEDAYRNVMTGLGDYLANQGTEAIGGAALGSDNWPTTEESFVMTLEAYTTFGAPGSVYARDVNFVTDVASNMTRLEAIRVELEYVKLLTTHRGETVADADKQIDAMEATRDMIDSWGKQEVALPPAFPYSEQFLTIEGFKIIRKELFTNVGLAILAVGIIVLATVAHPITALLITMNVAFCIIEILGMMFAAGIVIDSVSVINIVLAVGLSVDYSAHIGHCFMVKAGNSRDRRVTETLADIGAAVLCGATSTFLAVAVLLGSSSYVFEILSQQFALTVALGVVHGLILLPVLLSLLGPKPFASAGEHTDDDAAGAEISAPKKDKVTSREDTGDYDA